MFLRIKQYLNKVITHRYMSSSKSINNYAQCGRPLTEGRIVLDKSYCGPLWLLTNRFKVYIDAPKIPPQNNKRCTVLPLFVSPLMRSRTDLLICSFLKFRCEQLLRPTIIRCVLCMRNNLHHDKYHILCTEAFSGRMQLCNAWFKKHSDKLVIVIKSHNCIS